jgi:hypothetical protein
VDAEYGAIDAVTGRRLAYRVVSEAQSRFVRWKQAWSPGEPSEQVAVRTGPVHSLRPKDLALVAQCELQGLVERGGLSGSLEVVRSPEVVVMHPHLEQRHWRNPIP